MESATRLDEEASLLLRSPRSAAERLAIPPQAMPQQDPKARIGNMDEVALGFSESQAIIEANRCLNCKSQPCVEGCPVRIDIPGFVARVAKGDFEGAYAVISRSSLLPAICGRVCPQETQCQKLCTVGKARRSVDQAVGIGRLERFVADRMRAGGLEPLPEVAPATGRKVAVVGSGPASISAAADLREAGHEVWMFEALHRGGGVLVYGIPEFRLPKSIVAEEIGKLERMGVHVVLNFLVGRTMTLEDLIRKERFDAVFLGTGAGLPKLLDVPGENLVGVFSANEYLTRSNLMRAYDRGRALTPTAVSGKVAVFGGGNVAMDAARTALRLGAEEVTVVYRRSEAELPARREEVLHAREEGVEFLFLHIPLEVVADERGHVAGVRLQACVLGPEDASGRRRPVPVPGTEHLRKFDTVIAAIGNGTNPLIQQTTPGIQTGGKGNFIVDPETLETSIPGVYAGGDIVLGAATVILAMGQGRKAAAAINARLAAGGDR